MTPANEYERADHDRDIRDADWRPGDPPPLAPHRLNVLLANALEVAVLVKGVKNIRDAAALVEQYAQTVAAEARLQAVIDTSDRILSQIGAPADV